MAVDLTNMPRLEPIWAIMPVLAGPEMTVAAISDLLAQTIPLRILVVNQGVDDAFRARLEAIAEEHPQVLVWSHQPALPSLSATWNRALDAAWQAGAKEAFVVNNDVRLHSYTVGTLARVLHATAAFFVSAVGVREPQFDPTLSEADLLKGLHPDYAPLSIGERTQFQKGGPDFSCFLIFREAHEKYRFDEGFIPAFCEDLDMHRRYMLGGDGDKIFSINLPYLHLASQTLKQVDSKHRERLERQIQSGSRAHYEKKWGGGVNAETYLKPFDPASAVEGIYATTPYLQAHPAEV